MPNHRLHQNFLGGTLEYDVAAGDTELVASSFSQIQAVTAPDYQALVLNPTGADVEIVWITSHAAGSASITVTRAQEGTSAAAHASTEGWLHAPTAADFAALSLTPVASTGLPASPAEGDAYFETDLYTAVVWNGTAWTPLYGYSLPLPAAPSGYNPPSGQGLFSDGTNLILYGTGSSDAVQIRPAGAASSAALWILADGKVATGKNTLDDGSGNSTVDGDLTVAGAATVDGNLDVVGTLTAPTPAAGTANTDVATTEFVAAADNDQSALYWMSAL